MGTIMKESDRVRQPREAASNSRKRILKGKHFGEKYLFGNYKYNYVSLTRTELAKS